jgi:hypothetical protein
LKGSTEAEDLYVQLKRCPAEESGSLPAFALVADGPQLTFSAPFQTCTADTDCNSNLKCVDGNKAAKMEEIFKDNKLKYTPTGESEETESDDAMSFPLMSDPISTLIFGQANGMKTMCKNKDWYGKGTQRMIRHVVRRMNNGPSDGKTDLRVCVPSVAVNVETDGLNNLKKFLPDALCNGESNDAVCREAKKNPLLKQSPSGDSFEIRGLEATDRKACSYQLLTQFSKKSDGKWAMKAETGRKWLTTKIQISPKFKKSACTQPAAIRTAIITKLKKKNYDLWQDLEPRHVLIQCTGYDATRRLLRTTMKEIATAASSSRQLEDNQELSISIQLNEKQEAEAITAAKDTLGSPTAIAETLAQAGVTDEEGTPISSSDVAGVEVASKTSDDIEVEKLPDDIASALGDDVPDEKKDEKSAVDWVVIGVLIGVGVMCLLMCAAGLFWYQCIRTSQPFGQAPTNKQATEMPIVHVVNPIK